MMLEKQKVVGKCHLKHQEHSAGLSLMVTKSRASALKKSKGSTQIKRDSHYPEVDREAESHHQERNTMLG